MTPDDQPVDPGDRARRAREAAAAAHERARRAHTDAAAAHERALELQKEHLRAHAGDEDGEIRDRAARLVEREEELVEKERARARKQERLREDAGAADVDGEGPPDRQRFRGR
jgi:hypothetical protein